MICARSSSSSCCSCSSSSGQVTEITSMLCGIVIIIIIIIIIHHHHPSSSILIIIIAIIHHHLHSFHGDCIDPWLSERSDQCPICKQSVMVDPDRRVCWCIPLERCRACCAANNGNLSPRVTQMIMLLVVAFLAIIVALFFLYPA